MRDRNLEDLLKAKLAREEADGPPLSGPEREALLEEHLPDLLRARYSLNEVRLPEASREAGAARLLAAVRQGRSRNSDTAALNGRRRPDPASGANGRGFRRWALLDLRRPIRLALVLGAAVIAVLLGLHVLNHRSRPGAGPDRLFTNRLAPLVTLVRAPGGAQVPEGVVDPSGTLHLTYGRDNNAYYAQSRDGGITFGRPVRLNRQLGSVTLGGEHGPKLARGQDGVIHVVWLAQDPSASGVWYTRSTNGGRSFEPERNVLDQNTHCDSATVAADRQGSVWIFWLDGRLPPDPKSPLASPIFMARSHDGGAAFSRNEPVKHDHPGLACACCRLEARVSADGYLYLSFRSGYRNVRDAYLLKGRKEENDFRAVRISEDDWLYAG
jgi:hypothetical protein